MKLNKGVKKFKQPEELGMMPGSGQYNEQMNRCKPQINITV